MTTNALPTKLVAEREADHEKGLHTMKVSHFNRILDQACITQDVLNRKYVGDGTAQSPHLVEFQPNDPHNPLNFPKLLKWTITLMQAYGALAVTFASSAYSGAATEIVRDLHTSSEAVILGVSMFVLGFAVGPLAWAPLSELYGRQKLFFVTYLAMTVFNAAAAASPGIASLVVFRFFAGAFGSSSLTNSGGVIADMFDASQRGLAISVLSMAPFLGPALGPIVGGFLGEAKGWRYVEGLTTILTGILWVASTLIYPETYAPVLLRRRAEALSKQTSKVYISKLDAGQNHKTIGTLYKQALVRPWILLFTEPIVLISSVYMAIIYGTLYMCFAAFPIVFQEGRGWSPGVGGLAFAGIAMGMIIATIGTFFDNRRYARLVGIAGGAALPESRLPPAIVGSILVPVGMFWFAWTNYQSIHWIVPIIGSAFFAAGIVLVFLSLMNYLVDTYVIYAASVLAASSVLRSLFGAVFPLFTVYMYNNLGTHWATTIPAFLAVACVPFPFLFYKYGERIRKSCKFAVEASFVLKTMQDTHAKHTEAEA